MTTQEVSASLTKTFPGLIIKGKYQPPKKRCSRWILLNGPEYRDSGFRGTLYIDVSKIYDWARNHAEKVWSSVQAEEEARQHLPEWIRNADLNNEELTCLDEHQRKVLQPYNLSFIHQHAFRIWCPECRKMHTEIIENDHDKERIGKTSRWTAEWLCPEKHLLYRDSQEIRWIIR